MLKVIITTSDKYHHILPTFFKLYGREWGWPCELVGYQKPKMELPDYCSWHSLGVQRGPKFFSDDLRPYFEKQSQYFIWLFEDTLIKTVNSSLLQSAINSTIWYPKTGKFCLTNESMKREHHGEYNLFIVDQNAKYRLSSQPAIWNRDYLVNSLKPNLSPWEWEAQHQVNDGHEIFGFKENVIDHNEGVRKNNIHKLDLNGIEL